jgi:hypothetical protein
VLRAVPGRAGVETGGIARSRPEAVGARMLLAKPRFYQRCGAPNLALSRLNPSIFGQVSPSPMLKFRMTNAVNNLEDVSYSVTTPPDTRTDIMQIDFSTTTRSPLADSSATATRPAATPSTGDAASTTGTTGTSTADATATSGTKDATGASGQTLGASGASSDDPAVSQLKALIERLQKQLAALEQQIASAGQRAKDDPAAAIQQQSLSAQASTISAALSTAISQLAAAIAKSGGSQAGGLVSTQA